MVRILIILLLGALSVLKKPESKAEDIPRIWGDIIATDFGMPNLRRFYVGWLAFFDFVFSGALFAYFRTNWRYALFFLYPYVFMAMTGFAGFYLVRWALAGVPLGTLIALLAGLVCAFIPVTLPPRPLYIGYLLNDWFFAYDLVHRHRAALDQRLDGFARELLELARKSTADEILIVGHNPSFEQVVHDLTGADMMTMYMIGIHSSRG
jgi:hypothetical protein